MQISIIWHISSQVSFLAMKRILCDSNGPSPDKKHIWTEEHIWTETFPPVRSPLTWLSAATLELEALGTDFPGCCLFYLGFYRDFQHILSFNNNNKLLLPTKEFLPFAFLQQEFISLRKWCRASPCTHWWMVTEAWPMK